MPTDATFAGTKILTGTNAVQEATPNFTFEATGTVAGLDGYTYTSLGTTDMSMFPEMVDTIMGDDDPLWILGKYRGEFGNNVRVLVYDKATYDAVKYYDTQTETFDIPSGMTLTAAATAAVQNMWE
jgi:hypothetical protein